MLISIPFSVIINLGNIHICVLSRMEITDVGGEVHIKCSSVKVLHKRHAVNYPVRNKKY